MHIVFYLYFYFLWTRRCKLWPRFLIFRKRNTFVQYTFVPHRLKKVHVCCRDPRLQVSHATLPCEEDREAPIRRLRHGALDTDGDVFVRQGGESLPSFSVNEDNFAEGFTVCFPPRSPSPLQYL